MRTRIFWPVLLLPLSVACTALLGDFTVGDGGTDSGGQDTGNDVQPNDSGPDGNPQDGGSDVIVPKTMKCSEDKSARLQLNTSTGKKPWDLVAISNIGAQKLRVVVAEGNLVHAYTIDQNHTITEVTSLGNTQQVLDIQRLGDRFIAVTYDTSVNSKPVFGIQTIRDQDGVFTHDFITTEDPLPTDANRISATVFAVDPVNGIYFLAVYDNEQSDAKAVLRAGYQKISSPGPLTFIDSQTPFQYELHPPALTGDPQFAHLLLTANGPSSSDALLYNLPIQTPTTSTPRKLVPSTSGATYFPMAFTNSPTQGLVNLGVIEADLNTFVAAYHVGQVQVQNLGTFSPSSLPSSSVPVTDSGVTSISDLLIDKALAHTEYFASPMTESLLAIGRTADLNGPLSGFNMEWWDLATGAIRARQTGATNLLNDVTDAYRASISFSQPPLGALAQLNMVFEREPTSGNQNQPGDLWFTTLSCAVQ